MEKSIGQKKKYSRNNLIEESKKMVEPEHHSVKSEPITEGKKEFEPIESAAEVKVNPLEGNEGYIVTEKEKHLVHVKMDKPSFHPQTGQKLSKAFTQKFTVNEWNHFLKHGKGLGYQTTVLFPK